MLKVYWGCWAARNEENESGYQTAEETGMHFDSKIIYKWDLNGLKVYWDDFYIFEMEKILEHVVLQVYSTSHDERMEVRLLVLTRYTVELLLVIGFWDKVTFKLKCYFCKYIWQFEY